MNISFRPYKNDDYDTLRFLIKKLYDEDPGYCRINNNKIENTINEFTKNPEKGCIIVFQLAQELVGYSIIINYWSNEYGGNIVIIDELYIVPAHRRKGYATYFFQYLYDKESKKSKGIQLEVGKKNKTVFNVYKRKGFKLINNHIMFRDF